MISNRLKAIVSLIKNDNNIADIGSDHGYVLLELRKKGFKSKLLGVENKEHPFLRLKKNIMASGIKDIACSLSNGLDALPNNYKTIVIAGMGFDVIKNIISQNIDKLDHITNIVIDSHTDKDKVRPYFLSLGYDVEDETIIFEDNIYYDLIAFIKVNSIQKYSKEELEFGKINLKAKSSTFINMLNAEIVKNNDIINKINNSNSKRINELEKSNNYLRGILNENKSSIN